MKSTGMKMRLTTGNGINSQKNGGMIMPYTVNYYLLFNDGEMRSFEEKFAFYPTDADIVDVGYQIIAEYGASSFCSSRG